MRKGSTGSHTRDSEYGWGPNNEFFYELWPMEIPDSPDVHENDPLVLPLRVPMGGLLHNLTNNKE